MLPYICLLLFIVITAYFSRLYFAEKLQKVFLIIIALVLVLFAGLRNYTVGTDTHTYLAIFNRMNEFEDVFSHIDFGFYILVWLARQITTEYFLPLLFTAAIIVACYLTAIQRLVKNYETALYLFIAVEGYLFFFNGARQGLAAAVCFLAIPFILERKLWPYLALVLIATTFHRTALITIPLYWLASPTVDKRRLIYLAIATIVMFVSLKSFVRLATELFSDKYANYAEAGKGGGVITMLFLLGQGALLYYAKQFIPDEKGTYSRLLNIYLIGLVPVVAGVLSNVNPSGILRFKLYFCATAILLWPMFFEQIKDVSQKLFIGYIFIIITSAYFYMTTSTFSNLTPYILNQELFG